MKNTHIKIFDIKWDLSETGWKTLRFAKEMIFPLRKIAKDLNVLTADLRRMNEDDLGMEVSDWLSDTYGLCHRGFSLEWHTPIAG